MENGQPVLIDFSNSVFDRAASRAGTAAIPKRDNTGRHLRTRAHRFVLGANKVAPIKSRQMLADVKTRSKTPVILVIGGGAIGSGAEMLYADRDVQIIGTDVYTSNNTCIAADGHNLPFCNEVFDGVWVQAVLEHVLDPWAVVAEIHRVLKPGGLVYADTPFMQPVHEAAYDFTRFTQSGHRWLFRHFDQVDAGAVFGAGSSLIWAIQYFFRAIGAGSKIAFLAAAPFFWLRFFDRIGSTRRHIDAAAATFFYGTKSESARAPKDMIQYYEQQNAGVLGSRAKCGGVT
jgi:SAM-dependent methyltransferase